MDKFLQHSTAKHVGLLLESWLESYLIPAVPGDGDGSAVAPQPPLRFVGAHAADHEVRVGDLGGETALRAAAHTVSQLGTVGMGHQFSIITNIFLCAA